MAEVTKEDINRIYDKLDPMGESIVRIETQLKLMVIPAQPCAKLTEHLADCKDTKKTFKTAMIRAVVDVGKVCIGGVIVYFFSNKK